MPISKQDRQGARTPADVERRYGQRFSEILGVAEDSREAAQQAQEDVQQLDESLDQTGVFNRLTNNGKAKGIYRDDEGNIFINADYIKSGTLIAQLVNAINNAGDFIKIENGRILSGNGYTQYFSLYPINGGDGAWAITFNNEVEGLRVHGSLSWDTISLGNVEQDPAPFQVKASGHYRNPSVRLQLPRENMRDADLFRDLYVYWRDNGDGTFSPVGYENKLQGG